ncbi:MAG: YaiI/YqxD family protein [Pseudomonadota bacterium]
MTTIYVDADACPVKDEVERVATRLDVPVILVCNGGIRPSRNPLITLQVVAEGPDEADRWIADRCGAADVVITSDLPLADRCIKAGAQVVQHNGEALTPTSIGQRLATRDLMQDIRAADPFHQGGSKPFSKADRSRFLQTLDRVARLAQAMPASG